MKGLFLLQKYGTPCSEISSISAKVFGNVIFHDSGKEVHFL